MSYDKLTLVTATYVYLYVIWAFSFSGIRTYQCDEVMKIYLDNFVTCVKRAFEDAPYKKVLEIEDTFKNMLERVDRRIRNSYHENNRTLVDDGLSDEFILEFISNSDEVKKIKQLISQKIMKDWVVLGLEADRHYLT